MEAAESIPSKERLAQKLITFFETIQVSNFEFLCITISSVVAVLKLLFAVTSLIFMISFNDLVDANDIHKHHQAYCIMMYIIVMCVTSFATFRMLNLRLKEGSFIDNPGPLVYHLINIGIALVIQFTIYFFYSADLPRENIDLVFYGKAMLLIQVIDLIVATFMILLTWNLAKLEEHRRRSEIKPLIMPPVQGIDREFKIYISSV